MSSTVTEKKAPKKSEEEKSKKKKKEKDNKSIAEGGDKEKKRTKKKEKKAEEGAAAAEGEKKKKKKKEKATDADGEVKKKKKKKKEAASSSVEASAVSVQETVKAVQEPTKQHAPIVPSSSAPALPAQNGDDSDDETPRGPLETSEEKAIRLIKEAKSTGSHTIALTSLQLNQDQVPEDISELEDTILSIDLSFNLLADIPLPVLLLSKLQRLKLHGNVLESLSILRGAFVALQDLDLNGNNLTGIPAEIGYLANLRLLDISNNKLEALPAEIGALTKLEELHLMGNQLTELPKTIGNCNRLEILNLANCKLKSLPEQITYMSKLTELDVSANKLESLPESLGLLPRLTDLKAINNCLKDLPVSIACCPYLQRVSLNGNEFVDDDLAVFSVRSSNALLNFLKDRITTSIGDPKQVREYAKQLGEKREPLIQVFVLQDGEGGFEIKEKLSHEKEMQKQAEAAKKETELKEKILNLKKRSVDQYSELNEWIFEIKNKNWGLTNPQDIVSLASYVGQLKPEMDIMRERIAPFLLENYKVAQPQEGEDRVTLVKRTVDASLDNVSVTVRALMKGIREEPDMGKVVLLAKDLVTLHTHFGKYLGKLTENPTA